MEAYLNLLKKVSSEGNPRGDRTGTGTLSIFGEQIKIDLSKGFPLLTTKKVHFKSIVHELIWFLKGSTNVKYLVENNVSIWNEWADQNGELGNIYGKQWIDWNGTNQIQGVIDSIKNNPYGRRHIVSAWNVSELKTMALPPCHVLFQFYVSENKLSCQLYQRSADIFLGVPFNIASYALLTHMVAQCTNLQLGNLIVTFGDLHLYLNHVEQAKTQLERSPLELPIVELNKNITDIFDFTHKDIKLVNYNSHQTIKAPIAI